MMDFVAIDFETANQDPTSVCAVGVAIVNGGKVISHRSIRVRPLDQEFSHWNTAIHGLTAKHVANAPPFTEVWPALASQLSAFPLLSHNAPFDMRVLYACINRYQFPEHLCKWVCTLALARRVLPGLPNHKLGTISKLFGIELEHHEAGSDARACAEIGLRLLRLLGSEALPEYAREFPDSCKTYDMGNSDGKGGVRFEISLADEGWDEAEGSDVVDLVGAAAPDGRLAGLRFVFTGELSILSRNEAEACVREQGGEASSSVSKRTNYVVVGDATLTRFHEHGEVTGKLGKAVQLRDSGVNIQIINETDFLKMLQPAGS